MRIATSTMYDQQTASIDNEVALQALQGNQLSTGRALNMPSDDPTHIAQDLSLSTTIGQENTTVTDISDKTSELNTVDQAMSSLTNIVQKARSVAVQGASDVLSPSQRKSLGTQIDGLLTEAIGLANSQYGGKYVFAGTASPGSAPVTSTGSPTSAVNFNGNFQVQTQIFANGQELPLSTSIQQAFNFQAADHSPDVFQVLMNLRDSLSKGTTDDISNNQVNQAGQVVNPAATPLNSPNFGVPLVADSTGNVAFNISSSIGSFTFGPPAITPASTVNNVIAAINAQTATTGVTAAFNAQNQKMTLTSAGIAFRIDDVASPGANTTANFTAMFSLNNQADAVGNVSRQLGDIDRVLAVALQARAQVGSNVQALTAISGQTSALAVNNTKVQSGIEDADIAKVVGQFSQTQTVLQAAYATTTRLESKKLFDFIQ